MIIQFSQGLPSAVLWVVALTYLLCVVIRLARFNVESHNAAAPSDWFVGLPSPAAAGTIASVLVAWPALTDLSTLVADSYMQATALYVFKSGPHLFPWLALSLAVLMVSRIRYAHSVRQLQQRKRVKTHMLQLYLASLALLTVPQLSLPILFLAYTVGGPLRALAWLATPIISRQVRPVLN